MQALLNADQRSAGADARAGAPGHGEVRVFMLASFSMPAETLRIMMAEARRFGASVVMRGFVGNSVYETQAALQSVFGDDSAQEGFGIDPNMFSLFDVNTVPAIIVVKDLLDVCETPGCAMDSVPEHDILRGNIPLGSALEIIANGRGAAPDVAAAALRRGRQ